MLTYLPFIVEGILINRIFYLIEEIKAGQTTNKVWLSMLQLLMNNFCIAVILQLFPYHLYWLLANLPNIVVCLANVICYVDETNQIRIASGQGDRLITLPYGLEKNNTLKKIAQFISQYSSWLGAAAYVTALCVAVWYGMPYMVIAHLLGFILEQMFQRSVLPPIVATLYRIISTIMFAGLLFGFDNWFCLALSLLNIVIMLADHQLTHVRGITTASAQFPISRNSNTFSFEKTQISKPDNQVDLKNMLNQIKDQPIELTFDHMRQSARLIEQQSLIAFAQSSESVHYDKFMELFETIDFTNKDIQAQIEAEITASDVFYKDTLQAELQEKCADSSAYGKMKCYLRQQMSEMITRLKNNDPAALSDVQHAILKGQARLILAHLQALGANHPNFTNILLMLAFSTGTHCSRMYLECFANIIKNNGIVYNSPTLSLQERVVVRTQEIKDDTFRKCYFDITKVIKQNIATIDSTDYHSFEYFVLSYGSNLYLNNPTLSSRYRTLDDFCYDFLISCLYPFRFADFYNHERLIKEVITGKLSADFQTWCQTFYPKAYEDMCLDEDLMLDEDNPNLKALAILMLLDCNIIQFKTPFSLVPGENIQPSYYEQFCAGYHQGIDYIYDKYSTWVIGERHIAV